MIQIRIKSIARNKAWALGLLLAALMATMLLAPKPVQAATFVVDRNDDPDPATANACTSAANDCSLRGAIVAANAAAGADTITLPAGTYTLTRTNAANQNTDFTGDLDITDADGLTITGAGARATKVAGGAAPFDDRIFDNQAGASATITGLTITGGKAGSGGGGGVRNEGDLTLERVAVNNNAAGGIFGDESTLNITNSTVSGNSSTNAGGVYQQGPGTAKITNSTISGNQATNINGGVAAVNGALMSILNSTIDSNTSSRPGGGIFAADSDTTVVVKNTIATGNTLGNCDTQVSGIIISQGNNISSDDTCDFAQPTDQQDINPRLGSLANNGGPTDTRALLSGSPAIDAGANAGCPATDQRVVRRPEGLRCDIGAFERPNSRPVARNDSYRGVEDKILTVPARGVLRNDSDADGDALRARVVSGPGKGKLTLRPNGAFAYKPARNFNGTVRFAYRASDGRGGSDRAVVTLRIKARPR